MSLLLKNKSAATEAAAQKRKLQVVAKQTLYSLWAYPISISQHNKPYTEFAFYQILNDLLYCQNRKLYAQKEYICNKAKYTHQATIFGLFGTFILSHDKSNVNSFIKKAFSLGRRWLRGRRMRG